MSTDTRHRGAIPGVPPREAVSFARKRPDALFGVKAVGSFLPGLTRKAFEKYGFSAATLITDWPTIVGRELAAVTAPERLKWPRPVEHAEDDTTPPAARAAPAPPWCCAWTARRRWRCSMGRARSSSASTPISAMRPLPSCASCRRRSARPSAAAKPQQRARPEPLTNEVAGVADAGLRDALARLGAGIRAGR